MLIDDADRRAPRAGADARPSGAPRHGAEPRHVLPGARSLQAVLRRAARHRPGRDGRFAALTGRRYRLFDYVGHPEAERVIVMMGSGAETAHETVDWLRARGERVGVLKVRLYRPFSARGLRSRRCRRRRGPIAVLDRTKEPGARRRAALPGRASRRSRKSPTGPIARAARASSAGATACRPRNSRRRWSQAVFDELRRPSPQQPLHRRHRGRRDPLVAGVGPRPRHRAGRRVARACSSAWARTAPWAPTRTRSRSSARRRRLRPGLLRLRLEEVGRDHRLAPALRPAADPVART